MNVPRHHSVSSLVIVASILAAGCAPPSATLALLPTPLPLNVRLTREAPSAVAAEPRVAPRDEIPLAESARYAHIQDLLIARVPGVEVRPTGNGQFALFVRGRPALSDRHEALVVIDGMQFSQDGSEALSGLTPRDVKRVEVLRDAAATGSYGTRGANGVVLVTTRHGDY
jgi:TonB-dependent SusC/RagA subfamily outer membrane receptor